MSFGGQTPTIIVLKEGELSSTRSWSLAGISMTDADAGTDQSQGRGQVVSNINACLAVQSTIKGTLGPYGGDLLLVDKDGHQTITNDGATVMKAGFPTFVAPFD